MATGAHTPAGRVKRGMNAWEILERAIPRGAAEEVAQILGLSTDQVRRWMREPLSDENATGTGRTSPLDRVADLIRAVFVVNPAGARLIVEALANHLAELEARQRPAAPPTKTEIEQAVRSAQTELARFQALLKANQGGVL